LSYKKKRFLWTRERNKWSCFLLFALHLIRVPLPENLRSYFLIWSVYSRQLKSIPIFVFFYVRKSIFQLCFDSARELSELNRILRFIWRTTWSILWVSSRRHVAFEYSDSSFHLTPEKMSRRLNLVYVFKISWWAEIDNCFIVSYMIRHETNRNKRM
jgi:hypothetical protein